MMKFAWTWLAAVAFQNGLVTANPNCVIQGMELPEPRNLAEHPIWQEAMANLTAFFEWIDANANGTTGASNFSYSVQVYSSNAGPDVLWERFHTATNLPELNSTGVTKVDADTVYRLGSITKVFTVLTWLAADGDGRFNDPITKYIPEIAKIAAGGMENDGVWTVDWEDVTVGSLASQISGIIRDYGILGEVTAQFDQDTVQYVGFPKLDEDEIPECGTWPLCNRTQFFDALAELPPSFKPWSTPAYSNVAYQLLAYALEEIMGQPYADILEEKVMGPLGLTNTYLYWANESVGILPGTASDTYWNAFLGDASPSGNMYSSAADLTKLGLGILKSTLIKPALTRRWLKPVAFSNDIYAAVGTPWGLRRIPISETNSHRSITAFNKAGSFRWYASLLTLIPDWNLGFTIMMAGNITGGGTFGFADYLGTQIIPAYLAVSRDDANARFAGEYVADPSIDPQTNRTRRPSSITIGTSPDKPGLGASPWVSNGVNMVDLAQRMATGSLFVPGLEPEARLYYTGLSTDLPGGGQKMAFKAVFEDVGYPEVEDHPKLFTTDCAEWLAFTGVTYGGLPLDEFVFEVDAEGNAVSVENLALRVVMKKKS